jgi:hypothetical protein
MSRPSRCRRCRQADLGESLDAENIAADYAADVLTLTIPVHEAAQPRSIQVTSSDQKQAVTAKPRRHVTGMGRRAVGGPCRTGEAAHFSSHPARRGETPSFSAKLPLTPAGGTSRFPGPQRRQPSWRCILKGRAKCRLRPFPQPLLVPAAIVSRGSRESMVAQTDLDELVGHWTLLKDNSS